MDQLQVAIRATAGPGPRTEAQRRRARSRRKCWAMRPMILARDGHRCVYCGCAEQPLVMEHRTPITRGGSDDPGNVATACGWCDQHKGQMTDHEYLASQAFAHRMRCLS